jgi:hypothetical protein
MTIDAAFQRFSLGAYVPRTVICMDNKYCEHSSWPESVAGAESAAEGAVWMLGCLGGEAVDSGGRRRASVTWRGVRRERVGRSTKKEGARGGKRAQEGTGEDTAAGLVSWMCALRCPRPAICSLPLFQASRAGFPRPKQPERDSETARGPWLRLQRRSTNANHLGGPCQQQHARMGRPRSRATARCCERVCTESTQ